MSKLIHLNIIILLIFSTQLLSAAPTSGEQAIRLVENWRTKINKPLGYNIGTEIIAIKTIYNNYAETLYHIVSMKPDGFVIVSGDDQIEPVIAFIQSGTYDEDVNNPLYTLISSDLKSRLAFVRNRETQSRSSSIDGSSTQTQTDRIIRKAENKWAALDKQASPTRRGTSLTTLPDIRVAPLLTTKWNQKGYSSGAGLSYNRYTPQNRHAGCVAVALAQVMRYHEHDAAPSTVNGRYYIDDYQHRNDAAFLGGDGQGSAYNWALMSDGSIITNEASAIAIGRFLFDAGISVSMLYKSNLAETQTQSTASALINKFYYSNVRLARYIRDNAHDRPIRNTVLNSNLDAGLPLIASIGGNGGHSINSDGYGYDNGTLYHHLNMGWGGTGNVWYNLPDIGKFSSLSELVYNIYTNGTGEIISGRVTDNNGQAIANTTITAKISNGLSYTAATNEQGIYALTKLPSNTTYTISAVKNGYRFATQQAQTKESIAKNTFEEGLTVGNVWGVDFQSAVVADKHTTISSILYLLQ